MKRARYPRTVAIEDAGISWTDVGGWINAIHRITRPCWSMRNASTTRRLHRSLTIDDIRHCDDERALTALVDLLAADDGCGGMPFSAPRRNAIRGAAMKRLAGITSGRAYARPTKGGARPSETSGTDQLRRLVHHHPDLIHVDGLRSELRRREMAQ